MTRSRPWPALSATTLALILLTSFDREGQRAQSLPGPYVVTDLGTLGTVQSAQATDINDAGHVVGAAFRNGFLWQNGVMTALSTLGGPTSTAAGMNESGRIVGASTIAPGSQVSHPVLWDDGVITDLLAGAPAGESGGATAVNESGEVVGTLNYGVPFHWKNGVRTNLGHLGGGGGSTSDINDAGLIVGSSSTAESGSLGPIVHAVLWDGGATVDLGLLPGDEEAWASAINNLGQIVGTSGRTDPDTYEQSYRSFIHENGAMTPLPVPSSESYATDINDSGVVVGTMRAGGGWSNFHAYIYANGVATNLNSRIPANSGLHLLYAYAINNSGQIVGVAYDSRASYHAYLLTPVAPGTPVVNIGDASVSEGHTGTRSATFTATLSTASSQPITISFGTANGSASTGDYQATSGSVTFAAGQTSRTISVPVNGDRLGEENETFVVNLSVAGGTAVLGDSQGLGTILDDEPRISINSVTKNEGNSGTTAFVFTVSLSAASDVAVTLNFATAANSAKLPEDFDANSGSLSFAAGQTTRTVTVLVKGDRKREAQEVFYVNLANATNAFIIQNWGSNMYGTGVVKNDD